MDEMPTAYIELDLDGHITLANPAACALQQQSEAQLLGCTPWQFMPSREAAKSIDTFIAIILASAPLEPIRRSSYTANGECRTHELHCCLRHGEDGKIAGLRVVLFDVTEMQRANEEALKTRAYLESVLMSMSVAIVVTDALGFVRLMNPAAESLSGWTSEEMLGRPLEDRIPFVGSEAVSGSPFNLPIALDGPSKGVARFLNHAGKQISVEISTSPILDPTHHCTTGIVSVWRPI